MKFGKTLKRVLHPPWCDEYVDYKWLKQLIKRCCTALDERMRSSTPFDSHDATRLYGLHRLSFFLAIRGEVDKVSSFYLQQLETWEAEYQLIVSTPPSPSLLPSQLLSLRSLCDLLDKLRSFVLLNHLAFIKILKKYDKHVSSLTHTALSSRVMAGLLGYGPSGEVGSASIACMDTIMQSPFYSSPRLAVLLTNVQVQMAMRTTEDGGDKPTPGSGAFEEKEAMEMDGDSTMRDVTSSPSSSPSLTSDDFEFTCPICLDVLTLPVILSCSHRFCFSCLASWSTQSQKCPVCRLEHPLHPDSYTVSNTLDTFIRHSHRMQEKKRLEAAETQRTLTAAHEETVMATATGEYDDDEMADSHDGDPALLAKPTRGVVVNPAKGVYGSPLHASVVNGLKHINTLLDVVTPTSYLIFDVDDTLITNLYTPCLLTTDKGIQAYQAILSRNPLYADLSLKQKNTVTRILQRALDSKRLVESDTQMVIKTLQEMGCTVFGLTKRWSESSAETRKELLTMGIDFTSSSPFPRGRKYCDECTESLLVDGVIYTNGHEKGPVLDRFLSQIVFPRHLQLQKDKGERTGAADKEGEGEMETKEAGGEGVVARHPLSSFASLLMSSIPNPFQREKSGGERGVGVRTPVPSPPPTVAAVPTSLIFIDDLHENASSVFNELSVCQALAIPIISCHYTAVKDQHEELLQQYERRMLKESHSSSSSSGGAVLPPLCVHSDMEVLQYQVYHLVHKHQVINDQQARFIITKLKKKAQAGTGGERTSPPPAAKRVAGRRASEESQESSSGGEDERRGMERMTVSGGGVAMDLDLKGTPMLTQATS